MNWSAMAFVGFFVVVGVLGLVVVLFISYAMASQLRAWAARAIKELSSNSAGDAEPLPVSGHSGSRAPVGGRNTARELLLEKSEGIASKAKLLEPQKTMPVERASSASRATRPQQKATSDASPMTRPQRKVTSASDSVKPRPRLAKCPYCRSNTLRVVEEAGIRRCSSCHSVLPRYIRGNN
jgi:hypothetical protein